MMKTSIKLKFRPSVKSEKEGTLTAPKFEIMNDARHIAMIEEKKETVYA